MQSSKDMTTKNHILCKRYIIGTCKKEKNIENIVLEKLRFSGALFFFEAHQINPSFSD